MRSSRQGRSRSTASLRIPRSGRDYARAGCKGVTLAAWNEVEAAWRSGYGTLAADFRDGRAAVAPRDAAACRLCGLQPLCRIQQLDDTEPASEGEGADDA